MVAAGGRRREVEDVALGYAEVLQKLPGGVGKVGGSCAAEIGGEPFDCFVEGGVGLALLKKTNELLAQGGLLVSCVSRFFRGLCCCHWPMCLLYASRLDAK